MDAKYIARLYGDQEWVYAQLLKGTATKFTRWKRMLDSQQAQATDDVSEAMRNYARSSGCTEIAASAEALHCCCQSGDDEKKIEEAVLELRASIKRLADLSLFYKKKRRSPTNMIVYSRKNCSQCVTAELLLEDAGIIYEKVLVDDQEERAALRLQFNATTFPILVQPDGQVFVGAAGAQQLLDLTFDANF